MSSNLTSKVVAFFVVILLVSGCGGGFKKSPLDVIIRDLPKDEPFSIILHDMDVKGNFSETYYHQYEIIRGSDPEKITSETTQFYEVSEKEFNQYINDMGMTIAARDSAGNVSKTVAPPGYHNYVGNSRYGSWQSNGSGGSFWQFYGQYAFMSSMFNLMTYPARRDYYNDWRGNYRGTGRRYYGPSTGSTTYYGTNSGYTRSKYSSSSWANKSSSFKNRVRSRVSRSSSSSSGSFRSRGGGFGK